MTQDVANRTYLANRPSIRSREVGDIIDWCMSASERDAAHKLHLRNMPNEGSRQILAVRVRELLGSFKQHDKKEIAVAIMDMLASYDVAQAKQLTAAERKAAVVVYVRELQGVPTWAVQEACNKIRLGTAPDISHAYKPTPIQVRVLAISIAQPYKQEAMQISEILVAPEFVEGPGEEERDRVAIKWRSLADALKNHELSDSDALMNKLAELERERNVAMLRRLSERSTAAITQEWKDAGQKPPMAGDVPISRALVKLIEERKKAQAAKPGPDTMYLGS
jgi:hypothetical protein